MTERAAVLFSGNGSTLQSILDMRGILRIPLVIATKSTAYGILRARRAGCHVEAVPEDLLDKSKRKDAEDWIHSLLVKHKVEWLFLAGFMWILSEPFIQKWKGRIVNIHPSLLPRYKGKDGFGDAFRAGEKTVGVTLHDVTYDLDSGPKLLQRKFDVPDVQDINRSRLYLHIQENRILTHFLRGKWRYRQMS